MSARTANHGITQAAAPHVHRRYDSRVVALAYFLRDTAMVPADTVSFLFAIDRGWPDLTFRDFANAVALAELLALQPRGHA